MLVEPTSHLISPETGAMSGASGHYEKKLRDLEGLYADQAAFNERTEAQGNTVVYRVDEKRPAQNAGDLIFGTTWMRAGRIGDEFYMTRGHIHSRGNRPETYYGESGQGVMLLESPEGGTKVVKVAARVMVYVPPLWIHRSVNTGDTPLVMSFCYPSDSGQDYDIIARSRGMASRVVVDGAGWKTTPNTSYRPRSEEEIAAVYATCD